MRSRDDLFQLIKSMSRSEKRYFVLDAKKSGRSSSRYLKLFDMLSGMEELDEAKLKKKFPKNLSSDKAYLYEAILRSMRDYRSSASKAARIKERLLDARYLHERGLYAQSNARILEAKKWATELEDNFSLLEIIREEQLSLFDRRVKVGVEQIEALQKEKELALKGVMEELEYTGLYFHLAVEVYGKGVLRDGRNINELKNKLPLHLLDEKQEDVSPLAERRRHLSMASYCRLLGDPNGVYENYEKAVKWWSGYPALKDEEFHRYVSDVTNLVNMCYTDERFFSKGEYWAQLLQNEAEGKNHHEKKYIFLSISVANLLYLMNTGNREGARKALPNIIDGLDEFGLKRSVLLLVNIVIAYFWLRDYRNCEVWCDQLISLKSNSREDIRRVVMLFRLVALFEQDEIDKLDAGFRSVNRFFKKSGVAKNGFENILLNQYLKRIFHAPLGEERLQVKRLKSYLLEEEKAAVKKLPLGLGEFKLWANQKLEAQKHSSF